MRRRTLAGLAVLPLLLAGCGAGGAGGTADGPIKIMTIGSFESPVYSVPWLKTAVTAAVERVNDEGGIDGRTVELLTCNDKFDPNEATACAQRAVSEKVVAVVGPLSPNIGPIAAVMEQARIPVIGPGGADGQNEATSPVSYPINATPVGMGVGAGKLAVERGGPNVVVIGGDNETARAGAEWAERGVEEAGGKATMIYAPIGSADYSTVAAKAVGLDPDAVSLQGSGADAGRIATALRAAGYEGVITGISSMVTPGVLKILGPDAKNIVLTSRGHAASDTSNPEIAQFNKAMKAADPKANIDDIGLNGWLAVKLFAAVAEGNEITDGASVIEALDGIEEPVGLGGAYPDYRGVQDPPPLKEYPRVASFEVGTSAVENGRIVPDGDFFDPFAQ
ncbi:ABC transporter substrate-binding protein [Streptomyces sp. NPDC046924]|uniref:ABC transporter substrate-binding protein n=1 Tax=Streptomyces sp. NPDC046924 TaxID=3155136 RepID=UPI0033CACEDA